MDTNSIIILKDGILQPHIEVVITKKDSLPDKQVKIDIPLINQEKTTSEK